MRRTDNPQQKIFYGGTFSTNCNGYHSSCVPIRIDSRSITQKHNVQQMIVTNSNDRFKVCAPAIAAWLTSYATVQSSSHRCASNRWSVIPAAMINSDWVAFSCLQFYMPSDKTAHTSNAVKFHKKLPALWFWSFSFLTSSFVSNLQTRSLHASTI